MITAHLSSGAIRRLHTRLLARKATHAIFFIGLLWMTGVVLPREGNAQLWGWTGQSTRRALAQPIERRPSVVLFATRLGHEGRRTANGHLIGERDRFVALPSYRALSREGAADYLVRVSYHGRSVVAPVWDVGPWNTRDNYWDTQRDMAADLPRFVPQASAAYFSDHNAGRDDKGRWVLYPAALDLADGTFWDDLAMSASDWVEVTFLWVEAPSPESAPLPEQMTAKPTPVVTTR